MPSPAGHERQGEERTERDWNNQLIVVCGCTGSTETKRCRWQRAGQVWTHITSPPFSHRFPRPK